MNQYPIQESSGENTIDLLNGFYSFPAEWFLEVDEVFKDKLVVKVKKVDGDFPGWFFDEKLLMRPVTGFIKGDDFLVIFVGRDDQWNKPHAVFRFTKNIYFPITGRLVMKEDQVEDRRFFNSSPEYFFALLDGVIKANRRSWRVYYNPGVTDSDFSNVREIVFGRKNSIVQRRWIFTTCYMATITDKLTGKIEFEYTNLVPRNVDIANRSYNVLLRDDQDNFTLFRHGYDWSYLQDKEVTVFAKECLIDSSETFGIYKCSASVGADTQELEFERLGKHKLLIHLKEIEDIRDKLLLVFNQVKDDKPLSQEDKELLELSILAKEL